MTEPVDPPRPPRDMRMICTDHPAVSCDGYTEVYVHLLDAHTTGDTHLPEDIDVEPTWTITGTWAA